MKGHKPKQKPKAKKAKAKKPNATTRSTGGAGFNFEDQISAWLLLKMLRGESIPGVNAAGYQVQMQTKAMGWTIDDLLVTATANDGKRRQLAISSKGNVQVTASGFPESFVIAAWELWQNSQPFQRGQDGIALATRGYNAAFNATWQNLKDWCKDGDVVSALAKINETDKHRKVFESIKQPLVAKGISVSDEEIIDLIRHLHVFPLGFQIAGLDQENKAIAECREVIQSDDASEAEKLWQSLIAIAEETRLRGGTLRLSELMQSLKKNHSLKNHPDFSASWDALSKITADYKSSIQISLPNNHFLERKVPGDALVAYLKESPVVVVYGDSGCGKSALAKTVLDNSFADAQQVWLGPAELEILLSEARRGSAGLSRPLSEVLINSTARRNVLVIDSAERLSPEVVNKLKILIASLKEESTDTPQWCMVVLGQTESWLDGKLQDLSGSASPKFVEVMEISQQEAKEALISSDQLSWLASHDEAVSVLKNLRALYWVMQAQTVFQKPDIGTISLTTIADKLWSYWTGGKTHLQSLLMKLAKKEASFQRNFPISQMSVEDSKAFDESPAQFPLRKNSRNCIEFQHDLASDWARFQSLKEIAHDTSQWAPLAQNPLWHNALRMLGQYLLREAKENGKTAWDLAFEEAEKAKETMPLAADLLLDALCLDPLASIFLEQRADLLFENNGKRLNRLLKRFQHIATRPAVPEAFAALDPSLSLYLEAQHRMPIYGRWHGIAGFLSNHIDKIANLMSPTVAKLCETWLVSTPPSTPERTILYRKEFSEIALATVRALQLEYGKGYFMHEGKKQLYAAAFHAALDLPEEVAQWALEMAQRRPYRNDIAKKLKADSQQKLKEHEDKLKNDPEYKKRHNRLRSMPSHIPTGKKLPPWPLGPHKRVEQDFSKVCTETNALQHLIKVRPDAALEVVLSTLIEDSPEEEYSPSSRIDFRLGLQFDNTYPTAFWKSPFFTFLYTNPETGLSGLIDLVNFCSDRWEQEFGAEECPKIVLDFPDGTKRIFKGDARVFDWSQTNSMGAGQLFSALAGLEKWLCLELDKGKDITPVINRLLQETNSASILGVLVNVGKYSTQLFAGPLLPLLANANIYAGDNYSMEALPYRFDISWARAGELVFNMAKEWVHAPYRKVPFLQIAVRLLLADEKVSQYLADNIQKWELPDNKKRALERRILIAQLDAKNYSPVSQGNQEGFQFKYPSDLEADIKSFDDANLPKRQTLVLPMQCEKILSNNRILTDAEADYLGEALYVAQKEENPDTKSTAEVAIATVILVSSPKSWIEKNSQITKRAQEIVTVALNNIGASVETLRRPSFAMTQELTFAAHAVFQQWKESGYSDQEAEARILRIISSRDKAAVATFMHIAHQHRETLGAKWWRLLQLGTLWSALSHLMPRYDDPEDTSAVWDRRLATFRKLKITDEKPSEIDFVKLAQRVERLEKSRLTRKKGFKIPKRKHYFGIDTYTLQDIFSWLINRDVEDRTYDEDELRLIKDLWRLETWLTYEDLDDDDEEDPATLDTFGYTLLENLARISAILKFKDSAAIWQPVFLLGSSAHYAIRHFLDAWILQVSRKGNDPEIIQTWKAMLDFSLASENWTSGRRWYYGQQLLRQLLGFHSEVFLAKEESRPMVLQVKNYYKQWVEEHLSTEEDNIAAFCIFLSSKAGSVIRLDGIVWIKDALKLEGRSHWRRDRAGDAMVELLDIAIKENAQEIAKSLTVREALLVLAADLVAKQVPAALALQERIRRISS